MRVGTGLEKDPPEELNHCNPADNPVQIGDESGGEEDFPILARQATELVVPASQAQGDSDRIIKAEGEKSQNSNPPLVQVGADVAFDSVLRVRPLFHNLLGGFNSEQVALSPVVDFYGQEAVE